MIYKSSLTQRSKIIIIFHAEMIEEVISTLHLFIINRFIIIGCILLIFDKAPDEVMVL